MLTMLQASVLRAHKLSERRSRSKKDTENNTALKYATVKSCFKDCDPELKSCHKERNSWSARSKIIWPYLDFFHIYVYIYGEE